MHTFPPVGLLVPTVLIAIGVNACVATNVTDPKEYPAAAPSGPCPDLTGAFENIGIPLTSDAGLSLTAVFLPANLIPSGTQVTNLRLHGPRENVLEIEALSGDVTVAQVRMPGGSGFSQGVKVAQSKPYAEFWCVHERLQTKLDKPNTGAVIYRARDGSAIVEIEDAGVALGGLVVEHHWFRFPQTTTSSRLAQ